MTAIKKTQRWVNAGPPLSWQVVPAVIGESETCGESRDYKLKLASIAWRSELDLFTFF
jgi:hypothetical protein